MNLLKNIKEKCDQIIFNMSCDTNKLVNRIDLLDRKFEIIMERDKLINDIIHNIYAQDTSLQLVVMKPYRGKAVVYKDGKRLDTESTTSIDVLIDELGRVEATVRNE